MPTIKRTRTLSILALLPILAAGCDQSTTELIEEIDAAREGCTEEMLKASDEECVKMFERYAEMGEDALETYIGGMKALDEALRRRGGIQFDTAGIGRVFSDSSLIGSSSSESGGSAVAEPYVDETPSWATDPGPTWSRQSQERSIQARRPAESTIDPRDVADPWTEDPGAFERNRPSAASTEPRRQAAPARRGAILPPEERLRRPWIDDSEPGDGYYGRRDPVNERRSDENRDPFDSDPVSTPYPRE